MVYHIFPIEIAISGVDPPFSTPKAMWFHIRHQRHWYPSRSSVGLASQLRNFSIPNGVGIGHWNEVLIQKVGAISHFQPQLLQLKTPMEDQFCGPYNVPMSPNERLGKVTITNPSKMDGRIILCDYYSYYRNKLCHYELWVYWHSIWFDQTHSWSPANVQANVQLKEVPEAKIVLEKYNLMTLGRNGWGIWAEIDRTGKMIDPTMIE